MKPAYLAVLGTLALAASGCVGEFTTGGPPSDVNPNPNPNPGGTADAGPVEPVPTGDDATARALFEANVASVLLGSCGTAGCHTTTAPAFVADSVTTSYDKVSNHRSTLYPGYISTGSKLLANGSGGHKGAVFSDTDVAAITAWLAQEKIDLDAGGEQLESAMAVFSGCMDLQDWDDTNVGDLWADKNAGNQGDCDACHNLGADGMMASNQDARVFSYVSGEATLSAQFMPSYFTLDATGTNVIINRARLEKVGNQLPPHENHGAFDVDGNAMEALQAFYDKTMLRKAAGQCGPPRF